jgi:hypothetical protein
MQDVGGGIEQGGLPHQRPEPGLLQGQPEPVHRSAQFEALAADLDPLGADFLGAVLLGVAVGRDLAPCFTMSAVAPRAFMREGGARVTFHMPPSTVSIIMPWGLAMLTSSITAVRVMGFCAS